MILSTDEAMAGVPLSTSSWLDAGGDPLMAIGTGVAQAAFP